MLLTGCTHDGSWRHVLYIISTQLALVPTPSTVWPTSLFSTALLADPLRFITMFMAVYLGYNEQLLLDLLNLIFYFAVVTIDKPAEFCNNVYNFNIFFLYEIGKSFFFYLDLIFCFFFFYFENKKKIY